MNFDSNNSPLVLIVDDLPKNLQLLGTILRDAGYKIAALNDPLQILSSVINLKPDLILLDVMMPGKDGFEVCKELKENSDTSEIPIIFLTAKSEQENINYGLKLGGADYVTKPFNSQELLARVETHVSLKRAKEKLYEQNKTLQNLVNTRDKLYAVIGHDLRGPVNGIIGLSKILLEEFEDTEVSKKVVRFIRLINQSSKDVWALLSDLLDWARMQSGEMLVQKSLESPAHVVESVIDLMEYQLTKKEINVRVHNNAQEKVLMDKRFISTILRNFLSNAVKFSENGKEIDINIENSGNEINISVQDYGKGMSEETVTSLFKLESHPRSREEENKTGSGFGLMLSSQLAGMHDGKIEVESELDRGSIFTLRIPIRTETTAMNQV